MVRQRQYSSNHQHAHSQDDHKESHGYQGYLKREGTAPYEEESIRYKKATKEEKTSRPPPATLGNPLDQAVPCTLHMKYYKDT